MYEKMEGRIDAWLQERGKNEIVKRRRDRSQKRVKRKRQIKHRPQKLLKKGAKIDRNGCNIDPKGSQNEAKTDEKSEQPLQDKLGPCRAVFRLSCPAQVSSWVPNLGAKIEPNS